MCSPDINAATQEVGAETNSASGGVSPTMGIMMGGQFLSGILSQQNAASMQKIRNDAAEKAAKAALRQDQKILLRKSQEEQEAYAQSNFDRKRRAMELEASANVAAGEAGVSGISVDRIMSNIGRQEGEIGVRAKKTYEGKLASIEDSHTKAVNNMIARMNSLPPVVQPNLLATAINVASPYLADADTSKVDAWFADLFNDGSS